MQRTILMQIPRICFKIIVALYFFNLITTFLSIELLSFYYEEKVDSFFAKCFLIDMKSCGKNNILNPLGALTLFDPASMHA